jgi:hypothetical protein
MKLIFGDGAETPAISHTCVAKSMISARLDFSVIITETQMLELVYIVGASGQSRSTTRTDSDVA